MKIVEFLGGVNSIKVYVTRGEEDRERTVKISICYLPDLGVFCRRSCSMCCVEYPSVDFHVPYVAGFRFLLVAFPRVPGSCLSPLFL